MPRKRQRKFEPKVFEKVGSSNLSATLYASMLQSDAFLDLSPNAMKLYTYMKLQLYGVQLAEKPNQRMEQFVFNKAMYTKVYPLFKNGEQFNKYCHELIAHGFIEEVENGRTTRTKNIYQFSAKWKEWKYGQDYRSVAMKVHDEELAERRKRKSKDGS